jgi:hypothetical protein
MDKDKSEGEDEGEAEDGPGLPYLPSRDSDAAVLLMGVLEAAQERYHVLVTNTQ